MKAHIASLINAVLLITLSLWGFFSSDSVTAIIPAIVGVILLALNKGVKNENKIIAHVAVLLTLLILGGLVNPFFGAMSKDNSAAMARILVMFLSSVLAMVFFVKSFIDARKNREKAETEA